MSLSRVITGKIFRQVSRIITAGPRAYSKKTEDPEELNSRFEDIFNCCNIDPWQVRHAMNDLLGGYDFVPEPVVIIAGLRACRRINDYALSVRFLEAVKDKCGDEVNTIYPYLIQQIAPTISALGCDLPENLSYHKPELWLNHPDDV